MTALAVSWWSNYPFAIKMTRYHFDGDFRRMPQQSLGGASKVEERSELIRRAQAERQKREVCLT